MKTVWGEKLNKENPLPEYPRPQLERNSYINLNGVWEYAITKGFEIPAQYDGNIIVPFSPETELSGVGQAILPDDTLWYRRTFKLPASFNKGLVLLNFGAVDQLCEVFVNGAAVGEHVGGYTAFSLDITDSLNKGENELIVRVKDESDSSFRSRGKQKLKRGGIWYTPQSGIWQTVWLESVPREYISRLIIKPLFDDSAIEVTAVSTADMKCEVKACGRRASGVTNSPVQLNIGEFEPWSPEAPKLYDLEVTAGKDSVSSYFAMRKFSVEADENGTKRMFLNGKPYFHNGLLDQGYWSDGFYTAPSDEAMVYDISAMKLLGFNMLRKHIKIEPMRWYYHCDRLGMLVWQDMINGGGEYKAATITLPLVTDKHISDKEYTRFARENERGRREYCEELVEMLNQLISVPSIALWTPFNEGWGQFDAEKAVKLILSLDDTRMIDHASGWHDQKIGDIRSWHVYFRPYKFKKDPLGRAVALTEFGGYNMRVSGHAFNERDFGYKKFKDKAELKKAFINLYEKEIIPAKAKGLCASVYTQVSDVEDELNGLLTYDRRELKLTPEDIADVVSRLNDGGLLELQGGK